MRAVLFSLLLLLGACATPAALPATADSSGDSMDAIARDYVALILEIGEREPGYVDAYYGPAEWQAAATASPRTVPQLIQGAAGLTERLNAVSTAGADPAVAQRRAYLLAHVSAASARLRMLSGEKMGFADEAEALFGIRPELRPLESFDPVLAEIDALLPGEGSLTDRVTAFRADFVIPKDRLQPVMDAAIAECRRRTALHIELPAHERFTLSFVGDKVWSGYNYYLGDAASRIEINVDRENYAIRPHTDSPKKVVSMLFYLPEDDRRADLGTSIYAPKQAGYVSEETRQHDFEQFFTHITQHKEEQGQASPFEHEAGKVMDADPAVVAVVLLAFEEAPLGHVPEVGEGPQVAIEDVPEGFLPVHRALL